MDQIGEGSDPSYQNSPPFRIESRGDPVGRYLVASRDIKAGEVVFREKKPLAVGPNPLSQPQCIKCHVKVTIDRFQYISSQRWTMDMYARVVQILKVSISDRISPEN